MGWVGATNGILVFDRNGNGIIDNASEWFGQSFTKDGTAPASGQTGFSALATLAQAGATTFSEATSLVDATTGKLYFDEVQVWIDGNQDGVTQSGELHSLADLGIALINLTSTAVNQSVNGNVVLSSGEFTLSDGTQRTIDDIGIASQAPTTVSSSGPSAATLAFAKLVTKGLPALAAGQAEAVSAEVAGLPVGFSSQIAAMQALMVDRPIVANGFAHPESHVADPTEINVLQWPGSPGVGLYGDTAIPAPQDVIAALNATDTAVSSVESAANAIASGANALAAAQLAALTEDLNPSAANAAAAAAQTAQAGIAWGNSIAALLGANTAVVAAGTLISTATSVLAQLVPSNYNEADNLANGGTYAGPGDAELASASFAALASGLQTFASAKDALQQALAALGQTGNYAEVLIGGGGSTVAAGSDRTLLIAGAGSQTFIAGSAHDDFVFTPSAGSAVIDGFVAGVTGDTLEFLNVGALTVGDDGDGGTVITSGTGQVADIAGVAPAQLNLSANIVGVDTISFAGTQSGGTRSLGGTAVFDDGQVHVENIIASNHGDVLIGNQGVNDLTGGTGNDTLEGYGGGDVLDGGGGNNSVSFAWSGNGVTVNLENGTDSGGDRLFNIQNITGSTFADVLTGDGTNNILNGDGGNDTLIGGGGNDVYVFDKGYGQDIIINGVAANGVPSSKLELGADITADDLWLSQSGDDLVIRILGSTDSITVKGWFASPTSELEAIALATGLQLMPQAVSEAVAMFAAYQAANVGFDPTTASVMPSGVSIATLFAPPVDTPPVGQATNVALATQHAYQAALPAQAASQMAQVLSTMNGQLGNVSNVNGAASSWSQQFKGLPVVSRPPAEWYIDNSPGLRFPYVVPYTPTAVNPLPAGAQVISALTPSTFYFTETRTVTGQATTTSIAVGSATAMGSAISAVSQAYGFIAPAATLDQDMINADNARQTALGAAVTANTAQAGFESAQAQAARAMATAAEASFANAAAAYSATVSSLPTASAILQNNQALLNSIIPQNTSTSTTTTLTRLGTTITVTTTTTFSYGFESSTDQTQFDELQAAENAAQSALASAESSLASSLSAFAAFGGYATAQFAGAGVNLAAAAAGDFLIAGAGYHALYGGAGADTFAFGGWNDGSGAVVNSFKTGLQGDRLLVVPASSRTISLSDAGGSVYASFTTSSGSVEAVQLAGATLVSLSLYDNFIGVDTASFAAVSHSVDIDLESVTPRDDDGFTHIRNLIGGNFGDTLIGDEQDNVITGGAGNDTLSGGAGNDTLNGGGGINTVSFAADPAGVDVNLATGTAETGYGGYDTLQNIQNVTGSSFADILIGSSSDNVLDGGLGNDLLTGGGGNDTYLFGSSYGQDIITNGILTDSTPTGELVLKGNLVAGNLWFTRSGDDLVIEVLGTTSQVTISGWFSNSAYELQTIVAADGSTIGTSAVNSLVAAMMSYQQSSPGFDPKSATAMPSALQTSLLSVWSGHAPTLSVQNASGSAGSAIAVSISTALYIQNAQTNLSVTITGVPNGATLSAGARNADGSWTLTAAQLSGLSLTAPTGSFSGTLDLTVVSTATDSDGATASASADLRATIAGVATAPTLSVQPASGSGGVAVALNIASALTATDGTELLSIKISGVPTTATLSAGTRNTDGSWTLTAAQLSGLTMTVPIRGFSGAAKLMVTATATETDGSAASTSATLVATIASAPPPTSSTYSPTGNLLAQAGTLADGSSWINVYDGTAAANLVNSSVVLINPANSTTSNGAYDTHTDYYGSSGQIIAEAGTWTGGPNAGDSWFDTFNSSGKIVSHQLSDTANKAGSNYTEYYNSSGEATSESGVLDSGAAAGDNWTELFNSDGTEASYTLNDSTAKSGSSYTKYYLRGVLASETAVWTAGANTGDTYSETFYGDSGAVASFTENDVKNVYSWNSSTQTNYESGAPAVVSTTEDNGDIAVSLYDPSGNLLNSGTQLAHPSSTGSSTSGYQYTDYYDASGSLNFVYAVLLITVSAGDTVTELWNAGEIVYEHYNDENDTQGAAWTNYYSSSGVEVFSSGTYDNASGAVGGGGIAISGDTYFEYFSSTGTVYTLNDVTGNLGWSYTELFNSSGSYASTSGTYDSGVHAGDAVTITYNANGTMSTYSVSDVTDNLGFSYTNNFNNIGELISQTGTYDDGALAGQTYLHNYNAAQTLYDTGGHVAVSDSVATNGDFTVAIYNSAGQLLNSGTMLANPASHTVLSANQYNAYQYDYYYTASGVLNFVSATLMTGPGIGSAYRAIYNSSGGIVSSEHIDNSLTSGVSTIDFYSSSGGLVSESGTYDAGSGEAVNGETYFKTFNSNGTVASYSLTGTTGDNTLSGGTTAATLNGGGGYDKYQFGRGSGVDLIVNGTGTGTVAEGEIDIGAGISADQLWLKQSGNDLVIDVMGTHDQTVVANWFGTSSDAKLQQIVTSDGSVLDSQINQLVQAMATYSSANSGFNPTISTLAPNDSALQGAIAAAWHH